MGALLERDAEEIYIVAPVLPTRLAWLQTTTATP